MSSYNSQNIPQSIQSFYLDCPQTIEQQYFEHIFYLLVESLVTLQPVGTRLRF